MVRNERFLRPVAGGRVRIPSRDGRRTIPGHGKDNGWILPEMKYAWHRLGLGAAQPPAAETEVVTLAYVSQVERTLGQVLEAIVSSPDSVGCLALAHEQVLWLIEEMIPRIAGKADEFTFLMSNAKGRAYAVTYSTHIHTEAPLAAIDPFARQRFGADHGFREMLVIPARFVPHELLS